MFILDSWNSLFRLVFWMAPSGRSGGGKSLLGGGNRGGPPEDEEFEKIYKEHSEAVLASFLKRGFRREDADDLTQDTFLRVSQSIGQFRGQSSLRTWILSIAENLGHNKVRWRRTKKRKGEEVSLEERAGIGLSVGEKLEASEPGSLDKVLTDERVQKLNEAFMRLSPRVRECVLYRVHGGLKYREIAERMGTSIGTVKAQISQAKDQLKKELGPYFDSFDLDDDGE